MTPVLVDTGFLVALFHSGDALGRSATLYLKNHRHPLATVAATIVETCFHLRPAHKADLLTWVARGGISLVDIPIAAYPKIALTISKYADQDIDFVDAALVWLANEIGARRILTVDHVDFSVFRLKGGRHFEVIDWY